MFYSRKHKLIEIKLGKLRTTMFFFEKELQKEYKKIYGEVDLSFCKKCTLYYCNSHCINKMRAFQRMLEKQPEIMELNNG